MSSPEPSRRALLGLLTGAPLALPLAGCLHPLYGGPQGANLVAVLRQVEIDPIPDRLGHYLRQELLFGLDGSGTDKPAPIYRLTIGFTEQVKTPIVDTTTGRADAATIYVEASYTLAPIGGGAPLAAGKATGAASYDRTQQRFANIRAARDGEIRIARVVADEIRTRLSSALIPRA